MRLKIGEKLFETLMIKPEDALKKTIGERFRCIGSNNAEIIWHAGLSCGEEGNTDKTDKKRIVKFFLHNDF